MIQKRIFYSILVVFIMFNANVKTSAQNVEKIYMKSGSVVEGYIAEQKPGKYITFQTIKAIIVVNSDSLQNKIIERVPLEALSKEWRDWAEQNNKYIENDGKKQMELTTLEFKNSVFPKVFLLEKGSLIKFIDLAPNKYTFKWGDMYRTVKNKRPENLFSGLKEVLVLIDNTKITGQIIEQFPGKNLKIATDKGEVLSFKFSQVKQIKTEKLNDKLDLWSQVQLLDRIEIMDEDSELIGFISSRTLGKEIVFEFESGEKRTIPQNKVISYSKIPNNKYSAVYDKFLKEGEILLDGAPAYFVSLKTVGQYLILGDIVSLQKTIGETICLEANLDNVDVPITLVKAHVENVTMPVERKKREIPWPVITYQDLVQSNLAFSREITPLGNVKISFVVEEAGDYVLYIQGKNEYIVINVIEKQKNQ